ncbi:MAG: acetyl-CoA decarbonylase/synthase complex subunit delta [Candidatus Schekmanbacteria bacterium]|nr:acetyl-CoA decarbonylase/synthase complex subunit delta [Candidatus Schekmanbacteria bacterium]
MPFTTPKETYSGKIHSVTIGKGKTVTIGGATGLPFLSFEAQTNKSIPVALEVWDVTPDDWAPELSGIYQADWINPVQWAKAVQDKYKADMVCLRLMGTHPDLKNRSASDAAETVQAVLKAVEIPLIILGSNHVEKDAEVLKVCAQAAAGYNCLIGKAQEKNYKTIAAAAMAYNHYLLALSNLDINLAKQLNILLTQMGVKEDRIIMDTMPAALGYGLEYAYSVIERIRQAALKQNDTMVQMPIIGDIGLEVWKAKEAKSTAAEQPAWGDASFRGTAWETTTALALITAGADALIMRHPQAMAQVRKTAGELLKAA